VLVAISASSFSGGEYSMSIPSGFNFAPMAGDIDGALQRRNQRSRDFGRHACRREKSHPDPEELFRVAELRQRGDVRKSGYLLEMTMPRAFPLLRWSGHRADARTTAFERARRAGR